MATPSWRTYRGYDGMQLPKFHPNRSIARRVIAFPIFCNVAAVRHLELEFCHSGPPTKSTVRFDYPIKIWCRSDLRRQRKCLSTPILGVLGWFGPLEILGCHYNPQKAHSSARTRHLSHNWLKSVKGYDLQGARVREEKVYPGQNKQELSYRKHIARKLRTQYVLGIHRLRVTQGHWKRNHWTDHTRLTINRVIWR